LKIAQDLERYSAWQGKQSRPPKYAKTALVLGDIGDRERSRCWWRSSSTRTRIPTRRPRGSSPNLVRMFAPCAGADARAQAAPAVQALVNTASPQTRT